MTALRTRPKRVLRYTEDQLQVAAVLYLESALPGDAEFWHTPNGGLRSKAVAAKLKRMGTKAGIGDLLILWRGRLFCIELKIPGKSLELEQRWMRDRFAACGAPYERADSLEDVERLLRDFGIPLKATTMPGGGWRKAA